MHVQVFYVRREHFAAATINAYRNKFYSLECLELVAEFEAGRLALEEWWYNYNDSRAAHLRIRSMSVGDAFVVDGVAYYCAPVGWNKQPRVEPSPELQNVG